MLMGIIAKDHHLFFLLDLKRAIGKLSVHHFVGVAELFIGRVVDVATRVLLPHTVCALLIGYYY